MIVGTHDAVARAGARVKELGARRVMPLPVSAPFHCALMAPAQARLEPELRELIISDPKVPIIANVDAKAKLDGVASINALVSQVSAPVLWESVVRELSSSGVDTYVEVGPGTVLSGLVRKIDRHAVTLSVGDPEGVTALETLVSNHSPVDKIDD